MICLCTNSMIFTSVNALGLKLTLWTSLSGWIAVSNDFYAIKYNSFAGLYFGELYFLKNRLIPVDHFPLFLWIVKCCRPFCMASHIEISICFPFYVAVSNFCVLSNLAN